MIKKISGYDDKRSRKNEHEIALNNILANLPGHVYWKNSDGVYLGCNDKQAQSLGLASNTELIGKTDFELPWSEESAKKFRENDLRIMQTGVAEIIEEPAKVDGKPGIVLSHKLPLKNKSGKIIGIIGISLDITQHKKDQETIKKIEHQLKGAQLISASIAHEIRTPLATTKASISLVKDTVEIICNEIEKNEIKLPNISEKNLLRLKEHIDLINKKTDQCNSVINMLLAKLQSFEFGINNFDYFFAADCVEESLEEFIIPAVFIDKIKMIKANDFEILGNQTMIKHIFMNFLKNAIYFIQKANKGDIIIWFENKLKTNEIHFKDTASGIAEEVLPHIFKPFFTTETSTGTGVGLAFSKMVMESHQGEITCLSKEDEYTEFILSFPKPNEETDS